MGRYLGVGIVTKVAIDKENAIKMLSGDDAAKDYLGTIVFLAEEGKRAMYLFSEPVKYVDENGALVDPKRILESFPGEPAKVCYFKPGTSFVDDSGNPVFPG